MNKISVVTGASGGMGYHTAKYAGENSTVLIADISAEKVDSALQRLREEGVSCEGMAVDVSNREEVRALAQKADEMGKITAVYNVAGLSPSNGFSGEQIMRVNAFGTVYMNEEFTRFMENGCFLNVASSTAYMMPEARLPKQGFDLALTDIGRFEEEMLKMSEKAGMAYALSKSFVKYYTGKSAFIRGRGQGNRVVSVSPGVIDTQMTQNAESERAKASSLSFSALNRIGTPQELAFSFVALADERNSFVNGIDLLVDGGCFCEGYNGMNYRGQEQTITAEELAMEK